MMPRICMLPRILNRDKRKIALLGVVFVPLLAINDQLQSIVCSVPELTEFGFQNQMTAYYWFSSLDAASYITCKTKYGS
ncbi:hypothetical protein CEXT_359051 [Caerostris extrusa]|uniref:Uncharacterized protein n=1 Tax=Caerostris extrusa TaxID=172846 RepID=A0AAV4UBJ4_CAEEX|nr:hypothetical protein CEXT_359051 [Caerostris extrusa]